MDNVKETLLDNPPIHKRLVKFFETYPEVDRATILMGLGKFAYQTDSQAYWLIPSFRKGKEVSIMVYENFGKKRVGKNISDDARHTKTFIFGYSKDSPNPCYDIITVQDVQENTERIAELQELKQEIIQ